MQAFKPRRNVRFGYAIILPNPWRIGEETSRVCSMDNERGGCYLDEKDEQAGRNERVGSRDDQGGGDTRDETLTIDSRSTDFDLMFTLSSAGATPTLLLLSI